MKRVANSFAPCCVRATSRRLSTSLVVTISASSLAPSPSMGTSLRFHRRCCASLSSSSCGGRREPELIAIDSIEVETVSGEYTDRHAQWCQQSLAHERRASATIGNAVEREGERGHHHAREVRPVAAAAPSMHPAQDAASAMFEKWHHALRGAAYWDVVNVDPFARSRITNFVRRAGDARQHIFEVREEDMSGRRVFVASCRLALPEPHRSYLAEGVAENAKDAELLAAMHAERVCDALGIPLFRLPSTQRRHADAARAEGRYAPMPEDPVRPDGTPVPPPLRMVSGLQGFSRPHSNKTLHQPHQGEGALASAVHLASCGSAHSHTAPSLAEGGGKEAKGRGHTAPLFTTSVAEAQLVEEAGAKPAETVASTSQGEDWQSDATLDSLFSSRGASAEPAPLPQPATASSSCDRNSSSSNALQQFRDTLWFPWAESPRRVASSHPAAAAFSGNATVAVPAAETVAPAPLSAAAPPTSGSPAADVAATFDPTEGGHWAMVTTASTRCSSAPLDALVLPCVYEPAALERVKDFFLQHRLAWKDQMAVSSAAVPGSPTRMYVVALRLPSNGGGAVSAKGKAQTVEVATNLAAMHAELLLDALGLSLFPADAARQARHAKAVAGFGRWAPNPVTGDVTVPSAVQYAPLPRPLKQQIGGDEIWLDPAMMHKANAYARTEGERAVAAMNDLNFLCGDCVEVNPPEEWLTEAVGVLRQWQVNVARNPFPELYVITVMGDFYRATTLTPVPREFGVRGGNAIGRTIAQAVQLCAMHAVDSLCALGVPLYADPLEQQRFLRKRRLCGRVTFDDMKGMTRPKGLVSVLKPSIVFGSKNGAADAALAETDTTGISFPLGLDAPDISCPATDTVRAYLPGYLIEGNARRLPPHIKDTLAILQLRIPEDFAICGAVQSMSDDKEGAVVTAEDNTSATLSPAPPSATTSQATAEILQAYGNDTKTCVQNYLRQQNELRRAAAASIGSFTEQHGTLQEKDEAPLIQWLADYPVSVLPAIYITGYGKQVSVHNIAYLRLPRPIVAVLPAGTAATGTSAALSNRKKKKRSLAQGTSGMGSAKEEASSPATAGDVRPQEETLPPLLAVGISLKKKDAERACYLHAAALLKYHCGEDVIQKYRAGLPRQGSLTSFAEVERSLLPRGYCTSFTRESPAGEKETAAPRPLMNSLMRQFMDSGKHLTAPRKRPVPGPFNPFY